MKAGIAVIRTLHSLAIAADAVAGDLPGDPGFPASSRDAVVEAPSDPADFNGDFSADVPAMLNVIGTSATVV